MSHGGSSLSVRNPGPFQASGKLKMICGIFFVIGVTAFLVALKVDHTRAWASFVHNQFFFLCLAVGGLFFAGLQWATNAMWSAPVRRLAESFTAYLPIAFIGVGVLLFGAHELYHWTHAEAVEHDIILKGKSGYLNMAFFVIREVVIFGLWFFFAKKLIGNSIAQDTSKDLKFTRNNKTWAPVFLIVFALSFTVVSFDQLMSLDPHWFSTIFGVYCFGGLFYSTLAALCLLTLYLKGKGHLDGIVNENHLHDIGKFMFAFTVFWAYIGFSQFLLIWYSNIPEETGYYIKRFTDQWMGVSVFLVAGKFLVPFLLLMPRDAKRKPKLLAFVACFMLFGQWMDILWMVQPEFFPDGPMIGWVEIGMFLGFLGMFVFMVFRFLGKHNTVAMGDPRLSDSVHHHHQ